MAKEPPKCKGCEMVLKWPPWTGQPQRPVEQSGKDHDCPKYKKKGSWGAGSSVDDYKPVTYYYFCGRCNGFCGNEVVFTYCDKCEMYPERVNYGISKTDNEQFTPDNTVKFMIISNINEVYEQFRIENMDSCPTNAVHMRDDGTMTNGYKITPELTAWYDDKGMMILKEMHKKIWCKEKIKPILVKN